MSNRAHHNAPSLRASNELIARAQRGEAEAFEAIYHQHKNRVFSLCLRVTGNTADSEELTQEAFMQVFRKIHTFRGQSAFSTWLHRLSLNVVLMRLRKKTLIVTPLEGGAGDEELDKPQTEFGMPDMKLMGTIDRLHLAGALAQLPPGYRQAFVLHDVHGYQHHQIATMLGTSVGNSKSQLHKARMALRKLLREKDGECMRHKEQQIELV
jgi:RNA polymerase sigma-70 factor (ECF subfamily)